MEKVFQLGTAGVCVDGPEREKNSKKRRRWKKSSKEIEIKTPGLREKKAKKQLKSVGQWAREEKKKTFKRRIKDSQKILRLK